MKKIIILLILGLAAVLGLLAYQGHEKSVQDELYEEAYIFFEEADYKKAIQYLSEAEEHNNLFSGSLKEEILYYKADSHLQLEEYEEAIAIYDELLAENPKEIMNYLLKGYCLSRSGAKEDAASVYETGYVETKDPEILARLCNLHISMEDYEAAQKVIEMAEELKGEEAKELRFLEIVICEKQLDYGKAYEAAVKFCEDYPDDERGQKEKTFLESRK